MRDNKMNIRNLMERLDSIENSVTEAISLSSLKQELANKTTEQDRANALNIIAWRENLPGLYDPQTGNYIKKQKVQPGRDVNISDEGDVEADRILSARGLLPSGAHLDQGGMFGTDEYQQKARASLRDVSAMKSKEAAKTATTQQKITQLNSLLSQLVQSRSAEVRETYNQNIEKELVESFGYEYTVNEEQLDEILWAIPWFVSVVFVSLGIGEPIKDLYFDAKNIIKNTKNQDELDRRLGARAEAALGEIILNLSIGRIFKYTSKLLSFFGGVFKSIPFLGTAVTRVTQLLEVIFDRPLLSKTLGVIGTSSQAAEDMKEKIGKAFVGGVIAFVLNRFKEDTAPAISTAEIDKSIGHWIHSWVISPFEELHSMITELTNTGGDTVDQSTKPADTEGSSEILRIQQELLKIDPNALPQYGADGKMGQETLEALGKYGDRLPADLGINESYKVYDIKYFKNRITMLENDEVNDFYSEYTFNEVGESWADKGKQFLIRKMPNLAARLGFTGGAEQPSGAASGSAVKPAQQQTTAEPTQPTKEPASSTTAAPRAVQKPSRPTATSSGLSLNTQNIVNKIMYVMHDLSMMPGKDSRTALDNAETILRKVPGVNVPALLQQVYAR